MTLGAPEPREGRLECFLRKDEGKKLGTVHRKPGPGGKSAVTDYRTLESRGGLSLVEAELLTGRTHQIRASFAAAGHPLLGDGKYGRGEVNRRYGETRQALYSYYLRFDFPTDAGVLNYLRGRSRSFCAGGVPPYFAYRANTRKVMGHRHPAVRTTRKYRTLWAMGTPA